MVAAYHPSPKPYGPRSTGARADRPKRVWLGLRSGQGVSNLYQGDWKARIAFWRPPSNLLLQCSIAGGATPPWAPRRGRRSPGIRSGLVEAAFVRIWARSRAVPTGLLEGWYPANTVRSLSRTRAPGVLGESGWASRGARASPICTRVAGRRESHFGAGHRISFCSIRSPMGPRRPGGHG